jgi:S-DNA-T family DNA segregation ATPase FtsK/SpoIIIE
MDIYKYQQLYREKIVKEPLPHLFIISDEFAELKTQQPEFMEQLISAARIGRSLGVHLILATQKPSGVVDDQIWSNSKFRVCLKVQEKSDSQDMIKCPDAAELSQTGRFYLQVGFNELFAMGQSAWCGAEYLPSDVAEKPVDKSIQVIDTLGRTVISVKPEKKASAKAKTKQIVSIVKYLSDLAVDEGVAARPLWLDPIPAHIYVDQLEEKYGNKSTGTVLCPIVGEYDDPFNQKQNVLTIPLSAEGNCLVFGATGNGKTTFATTLCYSLIKNHTPDEVNLYLMDYGSETL